MQIRSNDFMANHLPCGMELPQVFFDGPIDMGHVRNFAVRAEHLGYDSLWLQERIIGDVNMLEPVTLLSYVAAITSRLKLGTSVILLPLRNPIQLAKAYATLDVMSEGRAVMGVGLGGGHLGSHENVFGYTREGRVTRFTEAVEIMKRLWTEPKASFHGRFWNLDNVAMEPTPMAGWGQDLPPPDHSFASPAGSVNCLQSLTVIRRVFIFPNEFIMRWTTMRLAPSAAFATGSGGATKTPTLVRKSRSGGARLNVLKKFKTSSKPARSRLFSIRCSTKWNISRSVRKRLCRGFRALTVWSMIESTPTRAIRH